MRNEQDFFAGLLFIAFGGVFAAGAYAYPIGSASDMGPGYFPRLLGVLTVVLGIAVLAKSILGATVEDGRVGALAWKPLALILGANLLFGILIGGLPSVGLPPGGLILGVVVLVVVSSLASGEFVLREVLMLAAVLTVGVYLVCVKLLNLYLPLWPPFIADWLS